MCTVMYIYSLLIKEPNIAWHIQMPSTPHCPDMIFYVHVAAEKSVVPARSPQQSTRATSYTSVHVRKCTTKTSAKLCTKLPNLTEKGHGHPHTHPKVGLR